MPVPIWLFADTDTERLMRRPKIKVGDLVGFELQRAPLSQIDRATKRALDIAVAGTALILLSPLMLMTAIAIVVESGFPILFRQKRKGFGARPFPILKFRSMRVQENGPVVTQASKNDMRVTRIGRVIRRTSIDELPQLFNVLTGDMSIVGPRPHAVAHDDYYDGLIASYAFRQHVKPGITGWAQVNGCRGETREVDQMRDRVEHDIWYINNWSIWLDIRIIVMTAFKIFVDKQAY
jgi:exopolysaccharide biosynthesis polyprenyl glycosylphosphotransferase